MTSWLLQIGISGKLLNGLVLIVTAISVITLPGTVNIDTKVAFFENTQWQVVKTLEIAPDVWELVVSNDASVEELTRQINAYKTVAGAQADFVYNEDIRSADNWTIVTVASNGEGYATLNELFFDNEAVITRSIVEEVPQVSIVVDALDPSIYTTNGGTVLFRFSGASIVQSDANQTLPTNNTAIWTNPMHIEATLTEISGPPSNAMAAAGIEVVAEATAPAKSQPVQIQETNIIRNGDFELPFEEDSNGVAPEWEGYDNGQAAASWYEELWPEAVHRGNRAQLMEIFEVEPNILDRVIAIYQTVDVQPDSRYDLELYAILRSDADEYVRNTDEIEMHWGIDPFGEGNYDNVEEWIRMPLMEQTRLGSTGEYPFDIPLVYERITGTVTTGPDAAQITLFIRGLKKFPNNVEALYDVDDVSLTGPVLAIAAKPTAALTQDDTNLPTSGAELSRGTSPGIFVIGGIILVMLGSAAAYGVLGYRKRSL